MTRSSADHAYLAMADATAICGYQHHRHQPEDVIFAAGQAVRGVMQIADGVVAMISRRSDGTEHVIDFLQAGDFLEPGAGDMHHLTARAVTQVSLRYHSLENGKLPTGLKFRMLQNAHQQFADHSPIGPMGKA